jgi:GNAT superfamily N-acetyltransferase
LHRDRVPLDAWSRKEDLTRPELDLLTVAGELCATLDDEVELLLLLTLPDLVVRDDQELALVRLEGVDPERLDAEETAHVVCLAMLVRELLAGFGPPFQDVRGALLHRLAVALDREAGYFGARRDLAQLRHAPTPGIAHTGRLPELRPADQRDLETLLAIQREAAVDAFAHVYPPERYPFPDDAIREVWAEALADPEVEVYVAELDGLAVGAVSVGRGCLSTLYVLPTYQGRGVGGALHDLALERLRATGALEAKLWTLRENHSGRRFYEVRGWELTDETRVVPYPPNPVDVQYVKRLDSS